MAITLQIICSPERIFAHDAGNVLAFGLNIGIATDAPLQVPENYLRPWMWPQIAKISCRFDVGSDATPAVEKLLWLSKKPEDKRTDDGYAQLIANVQDFQQNATFNWGGPEVRKSAYDPGNSVQVHWPAFLLDLSLRPSPIPQVLNLAYFFKVTPPPGATRMWIAPVLPANVLPS